MVRRPPRRSQKKQDKNATVSRQACPGNDLGQDDDRLDGLRRFNTSSRRGSRVQSTPAVTIELVVADQDSKRFGTAPDPIRIGAVQLHGWQVHPIKIQPGQFDGAWAYLVKLNFELETTPETPEMNWFEFGVKLRAGSVLDAVPHHTQPTEGSLSYVVNDRLNLVPGKNGATPDAHLPTAGETIHAFGVGSSGVRWQHRAASD